MAPCVRCGGELPAGARYCPGCGAAASVAEPVAAAAGGLSVTEGVAVVCLILNVFVVPGLGSLVASRREGWYQILLAVAAFILGPIAAVSLAVFGFAGGGGGGMPPIFPFLLLPFAAIVWFAAWIWGLVTGIDVIRTAQVSRSAARG